MKDPWKMLFGHVKQNCRRPSGYRGTVEELRIANFVPKTLQIDKEYLKKQFYKQNKQCYWLGIEINPHDIFVPNNPLAPSVDRLDPTLGYIEGNCVITTRFANLGRRNSNLDAMVKVVKAIKEGNSHSDTFKEFFG